MSNLSLDAQHFEWHSEDFPGSHVINIVEREGQVFAVVSNAEFGLNDPNIISKVIWYEMEFNQSGKTEFSLHKVTEIEYPDNYSTSAVYYIDETKSWLLAQSAKHPSGKNNYRLELRDESFNLISSSLIDTFGSPLMFFMDSYEEKSYLLGSIIGPPMDELFYLEYDHLYPDSLPPIIIRQSEPLEMFFITSMKIDEKTGNMLTFYYNGIAELDTALYQVRRLSYFDIYTSDHGTVLGAPSRYYSHGTTGHFIGGGHRLNVLQMYDTAFTILQADTFGIGVPDNYPFYMKSLDLRENALVVGGHLDGPFTHANVPKSIKKFYLAKYNTDMTQQWYKEYGGDRAYWMAGVHLLEDGGALAYGFVTDSVDEYRYAYILHVDENGDVISSIVGPQQHSGIQVVNPGAETLTLLNPNHLSGHISLSNLEGKIVLEENFSTEISEFQMDKLPAGLYPYFITVEDKVIKSGKWLKSQ